MDSINIFRGFHIRVYGDAPSSEDGNYEVTFDSGLQQPREPNGKPQQVPQSLKATVQVRGDEMRVSWIRAPDKFMPSITLEDFEEEAKRQVQAFRSAHGGGA